MQKTYMMLTTEKETTIIDFKTKQSIPCLLEITFYSGRKLYFLLIVLIQYLTWAGIYMYRPLLRKKEILISAKITIYKYCYILYNDIIWKVIGFGR